MKIDKNLRTSEREGEKGVAGMDFVVAVTDLAGGAALFRIAISVGAGSSKRRTAANTGEAGAMHGVAFFAGEPAPTESAAPRVAAFEAYFLLPGG